MEKSIKKNNSAAILIGHHLNNNHKLEQSDSEAFNCPNIIDLDKNRIVLKKRRLKSLTRPLSNLFKNPFGSLASHLANVTGPKSPTDLNNDEVKIDIELIKKLEDEIYKREQSKTRSTAQRRVRDDVTAKLSSPCGGDECLVFKRGDTSAFGGGTAAGKPLLLLDSRKLEPLLLKSAQEEANTGDDVPLYANIDVIVNDGGANQSKSIIVVDNSNYYPVLMRYDISEPKNEEVPPTDDSQRLFIDDHSLDIPSNDAKNNNNTVGSDGGVAYSISNENLDKIPPHASQATVAAAVLKDKAISADRAKVKRSILKHFLLQRRSLNLSFKRKKLMLIPTVSGMPPSLMLDAHEDTNNDILANVKYKVSPQLYERLRAIFNPAKHKNRLKFLVYKRLHRHEMLHYQLSTGGTNTIRSTWRNARSRSLPLIDEDNLKQFCDNMRGTPGNHSWSAPDLLKGDIHFADFTNIRNSNRPNSQDASSARKTESVTHITGSNSSNNTSSNGNNGKKRRLQRASFRLKRHSVGSTDVVKTWVYRRRCLLILFYFSLRIFFAYIFIYLLYLCFVLLMCGSPALLRQTCLCTTSQISTILISNFYIFIQQIL